jgi:hypothetical protein
MKERQRAMGKGCWYSLLIGTEGLDVHGSQGQHSIPRCSGTAMVVGRV